MRAYLLGNLSDQQSGIYVLEALGIIDKEATATDTRKITNDYGRDEGQSIIMDEIKKLTFKPDIIVVLKGLEFTPKTIAEIREMFPDALYINWFFDRYFIGKDIWESQEHFDVLRQFDYFFCSLKGVATRLQKAGLKNAYHLPEACAPKYHIAPYYNSYQERKYGEDVSFIGSLGYVKIHPTRIRMLQRMVREGFQTKLWGAIIGNPKSIPLELRQTHTGNQIINESHGIVANASLINLGLDHDLDIEQGYSARIYRIMCAGGLYLSNYIPEIETVFKVNGKGEPITAEQDLVVFYDENDLVEKLDFLLEHDNIRKKIAENGKKTVLAKHTFEHRIQEMLDFIKNKIKVI